MEYKKIEIKKGINLHMMNTEKFKTNLIAIFLSTPITRENVTKNAVISSVLRRGTIKIPTQEEISKKLEEMYGADFDCGLDKTGDNHVLKFYLESLNDEFIPQNDENMLKTSIEVLSEIVCNPYLEDNHFKTEYIEQEKENIRHIIESKKDNKARYAMERCIEEMYKDNPYGLFKFGYTEDLEEINEINLYEYYKELISQCKIDIFVSGKLDNINVEEIINTDENIKNLNEREANYIITKPQEKKANKEEYIEESMEVTQGKIVIGLDVMENDEEEDFKYNVSVYNAILGGSANSKLFQNVREKASLAYTASSSYLRSKGNIFINCGIDIENYEKALEIIKKQIEDMKKGEFTEDEIEDSKKGIISSIKSIDDEQDTEIIYFFGQELSGNHITLKEYIEKIENVNKEKIVEVANNININTIYFLKN